MMYIVHKQKGIEDLVWHVGTPMPAVKKSLIEYVQADGDELEHIRTKLPLLRKITPPRVERFYGSDKDQIIGLK